MNRISLSVAATLLVASVVVFPGEAGGSIESLALPPGKAGPQQSGILDSRDTSYGHFITECPQAGIRKDTPKPLDHRAVDQAEKVSDKGGDVRTNEEYSCFPQNETSIAVNPTDERNVVAAQNDYRLGWATSGISASSDGGRNWYSLLAPFPSLPSGDNLDGGGDPALVFDRAGIVYYADINFNRTDDTSGIWVRRSTNGGFTWSRPCVAIGASDAAAVCGPTGDPRQAGDGTVAFNADNDTILNGSVPFNDKEYIAAGPRPTGVDPVCFEPVSKSATDCDPDVIGVDRIYVTWTLFTDVDANIVMSFSDDQGRSWSPAEAISGSAPFCAFGATANACDVNQFSVPTVHPQTGVLGVAFQNFNTPDENQYLFVRSTDGGATFSGPFFVTPVFDVNFPRAGTAGGRPDCTVRGQQGGRIVYTNSCFRSNAGGNVVFDKRGGAFADDLYLVMSDNRSGTRASSNADIFLFKSINGGSTWLGPTRVNNDTSNLGSGGPRLHDDGQLRQRPVVAMGGHQRPRAPEHHVQGPQARHRLDGARVAGEQAASGQLSRVDIRRPVQGRRLERNAVPGSGCGADPAANRAHQPGAGAAARTRLWVCRAVDQLPGLRRPLELRLLVPGRHLRGRL